MEPKPKKKHPGGPGRGVNKWTPTPKQRQLARCLFSSGATQQQVSDLMGVTFDQVRKHLETEYKFGRELADLELYSALWEKGVKKGDTACLIFLAKNRLGMTDKPWWMHPGAVPHPNDIPGQGREELCVSVSYRFSSDPLALAPPPPNRLPPPTVEAEATKAA